jgi:amino acid transporter
MFGMLSGQILNLPRVFFRLAVDGVIPIAKLASIHHKFKTPYLSILLYAGLGFTVASLGGFRQLAVIASASMLLVYFGVSLSVIQLRKTKTTAQGEFKIPLGYTVPIISAGVILYFLSNMSKTQIQGTFILIGILTLVYFFAKVLKKRKKI